MNSVHPCRGKNNGKKWATGFGYPRCVSYIYRVNDDDMSEFEVLIEKVAQRLAKNYRPHRATLNKLYAYPIDPAFREHRLKARTMELRAEIAERNKEIAETFARILSNPRQYETVGEPTTHNIKFG
ncbi:hypothetical protein OAU24_00680 [bacterium]|nr:hypothetical protein [bacterium]